MADGYYGEIRLFAGPYAPVNWHFCDGTKLPVNEYAPLYALIGITYGGDGVHDFALPDLRGRLPMGQGQGLGLTNRIIGKQGGAEEVTLTAEQMSAHNHQLNASSNTATASIPDSTLVLAASAPGDLLYYQGAYQEANKGSLSSKTILPSGEGGQAHDNMMPCMALNFIICLNGLFPERQ